MPLVFLIQLYYKTIYQALSKRQVRGTLPTSPAICGSITTRVFEKRPIPTGASEDVITQL
jgi:hypothetical protein